MNIRIFHLQGATVKNSIEKSSNSSKVNGNLTENEAQNASESEPLSDTVFGERFGPILATFWLHVGPILDHKSLPEGI